MVFNKGILMLAIIALTSIFEATCLLEDIKNDFFNLASKNRCGKNESDAEFDHLLHSSMKKFEECETEAISLALSERGENAKAPHHFDFLLFCDASPRLITCFKNFSNSVLFCGNQSLVERNLFFSALRSFTGYLCSEDAKRIAVLVEQSVCITESFHDAECYTEIFSRPVSYLLKDIINETFFSTVGKCILSTLDQCPSTDPFFSPSVSAKKFFTVLKNSPDFMYFLSNIQE
ncbi:uncharacterized protein LOC122856161 [Aphidius gifuensis]|uniref:uncharacterized protein LOC122856161 n=1 Tax=Aphidius gifuensis TaxID=684658 RepID=UPI001CDC821B|nr:uncharacterized protein LOC122856161 [Aphidius gifuensis]